MSSTSNVQNLLVNVIRPTYRWESGTGFVPSVVLSNITEVIAGRVTTSALVVSDSKVNTYIGANAGLFASNTFSNVGIGYSAMGGTSNAQSNVAIGTFSLEGASNVNSNVAIGAGTDISGAGDRNVLIGTNIVVASGSNNILIGTNITRANESNKLQIGPLLYGDICQGYIGINNPAPEAALDISGDVFFRNKVGVQNSDPEYSLDVTGSIHATERFFGGPGSLAAPIYSFSNSSNSGMYVPPVDTSLGTSVAGVGAFGIVVNSQPAAVFASNKVQFFQNLDVSGTFSACNVNIGAFSVVDGNANGPSVTFTNDTSLGLFRVGTGILGITSGGVQRVTLSNGFLGIGTATPRVALDVSGDISANVYNGPGGTAAAPHYTFSDDRTTGLFFPGSNMVALTAGGTERMRISNNRIGIGTTAPANALDVSGVLRVVGANGNITFSNGTIDVSGTQIVSTTGAFVNALGTFNSLGGVVLNNGSLRTDPSDGFLVAVGSGTNTIAYSSNHGSTWTGLGTSIFSTQGWNVAWNGSLWVAVGEGTNTIAYSSNGSNWTGVGTAIFSTRARDIAWNGSLWVAVGEGTNTLAYSSDGSNWTGVGTSIFSTVGLGVAWNGARWIAAGSGTNTLATSTNGITWSGLGASVFTASARCVAWNGSRWVTSGNDSAATGIGIAYSSDGFAWTRATGLPFSGFISPSVLAWNGSSWIAGVTGGATTLATSPDGITWTGRGDGGGVFSNGIYGLAWSGTQWVGAGDQVAATSPDGITWTSATSVFSTTGRGVASRRHILPFIRQAGLDVSTNTTLTAAGAIVGANHAAPNFIGGVTLSANDISMNSTGRILAPVLRNALTPSTYDISGGNISNAGATRSSNFLAAPGGAPRPAYAFTTDPSSGLDLVGTSYLAFDTSGVQRMCISGNLVGIGTTAPAYVLDVSAGNSAADTAIYLRNSAAANVANTTSIRFGTAGNSGAGQAMIRAGFDRDTAGGQGTLTFHTFNAGAGTMPERVRIDQSGNVGIGTSVPGALLDLSGGGIRLWGIATNSTPRPAFDTSTNRPPPAYEIQARTTSGADGFLRLRAGHTPNAASYIDLTGFSQLSDNDRNIVFGTSQVERVRIDLNGNVGIGTSNPTSRLNLFDASTNTFALRAGTTVKTAASNIIEFQGTDSGSVIPLSRITGVDSGLGASSYRGDLVFGTADGITVSERMRIRYDGNVGIGTTAPGTRLDVSGGFRVNNSKALFEVTPAGGSQEYANLTTNGYITIYKAGTTNRVQSNEMANLSPEAAAPTYFLSNKIGIGTSAPVYALDVSATPTVASINMSSWPRYGASVTHYGVYGGATSAAQTWTTSNAISADIMTVGDASGTWFRANKNGIYSFNVWLGGTGAGDPLVYLDVSTNIGHSNINVGQNPQLAVNQTTNASGRGSLSWTGFLPSNSTYYYKIKVSALTGIANGPTGGKIYVCFLGEVASGAGVPF